MVHEQLGPFTLHRKASRKRFFRSVIDTDDRGWTPLHIGARKGDIKLVGYCYVSSYFYSSPFRLI